MELKLTLKHNFSAGEKVFELFCIKNDFDSYLAKRHNFVSHITLIPRNNTLLYYSANQICLCCIISWNAFLALD